MTKNMNLTKIVTRRFEQAQVMETSGEYTTRRWFEYIDENGKHVSDYPPTAHLFIEVKEREGREPLYITYINGRESWDHSLLGSERWLYEYFAAYTFFDFPEFGFGEEKIDYPDGDEVVVEKDRIEDNLKLV